MDLKRLTSMEVNIKRKDALVPQKSIDLVKAFAKEKDKENAEIMLNDSERIMSSKVFDTIEEIKLELGEEKYLQNMYMASVKVEKKWKKKAETVIRWTREFDSFTRGHVKTAREKMLSADQSLRTAIAYCRKHTRDATQANKNLLGNVNAIIEYIKTNKMKGSSYTENLIFLPTFFEKCRNIVNIQESIDKYMSSWNLSAEGSIQEPSEGNKLIDKLALEINETCSFIKQSCHPYFLPLEARPPDSLAPTDPRLNDTANVTYELHRRMGEEYLPRIGDELYIKCLRDATRSHGEVLQKHNNYQLSREGYDEVLKEQARKQEELDKHIKEETLAYKAVEASCANYQLVLQVAQQERRVEVPVEDIVSPEVLLAMYNSTEIPTEGNVQ
jgi:hypothetical protein